VFAPNVADQVVDALDVHAAVGHDAALVKSLVVRTSDGVVDVFFAVGAMGVDGATVSGIEMSRIPQMCSGDDDCAPGQFCNPMLLCAAIPDVDADGLDDLHDPCIFDPRNLCFGPVAVDGAAGATIRLNAGLSGAPCSGTRIDCNGDTWLADFGFNAGGALECDLPDGCPMDTTAIFGCASAATEDLFQCVRRDPASAPELRYSFDVPDGSYLVNLLLVSPIAGATTGSLVFDVSMEGRLVYQAFDVVAEAGGSGIPMVRSSLVEVTDGDGLQIDFSRGAGNPLIAGIEVLAAGSPVPTLSPLGLAVLAGLLAAISFRFHLRRPPGGSHAGD
jgi:hypothetical protein